MQKASAATQSTAPPQVPPTLDFCLVQEQLSIGEGTSQIRSDLTKCNFFGKRRVSGLNAPFGSSNAWAVFLASAHAHVAGVSSGHQ
jgi:hypothetical protein